MGNETTIIIAHFDFSNSRMRNIALQICLNSIDDDIPIVLIRHVKVENQTKIEKKNLRCIDINEASVLWQRERFWNIALQYIKGRSDNIIWIDSDICFVEPNWIQKVNRKLKNNNLVHVFDLVIDKKVVDNKLIDTGLNRKSTISCYGSLPSNYNGYFSKSGISMMLGCSPGFAWAAKTKIMKKCMFPDFFILGSGDKGLLAAALGKYKEYSKALRLNPCLCIKYGGWADRFYHEVNGKVTYIENKIYHLAQGEYSRRLYSNRYNLLESPEFEFDDYIGLSEEKTWIWKMECGYKEKVNNYFIYRHD